MCFLAFSSFLQKLAFQRSKSQLKSLSFDAQNISCRTLLTIGFLENVLLSSALPTPTIAAPLPPPLPSPPLLRASTAGEPGPRELTGQSRDFQPNRLESGSKRGGRGGDEFNRPGTLSADHRPYQDCAAKVKDGLDKEEAIEELFGQLWAIPVEDKARVPNPAGGVRHLIWIRKDLVRDRRIRPKDCFPAGRNKKIFSPPKRLSFAKDIWARGDRATYAEALGNIPMAEGGRWVWQADKPKPPAKPVRGRPPIPRGRGSFNQGRQRQHPGQQTGEQRGLSSGEQGEQRQKVNLTPLISM
jgi:hypothetical protein